MKKKRRKGHGKGQSFERWVSKKLSRWVSRGKRSDLFWRTSMSGGRATVQRKRGRVVRQSGDICAVTPEGHVLTDHWYIECKSYRRIMFGEWIINNQGPIVKWWKRCKDEARAHGRDPMLIVKQNTWPVLVISKGNHLGHWTPCHAHINSRAVDVTLFDELMAVKFNQDPRYRGLL